MLKLEIQNVWDCDEIILTNRPNWITNNTQENWTIFHMGKAGSEVTKIG